jgi:hypothetical protein
MSESIESALLKSGFLIRPVEGDSMMPLLDQRSDTVKIIPVAEPLKKYDLPLYRRPSGQLVMHRIIGVKKNGFITCGDNRYNTEFVPKDWVIAKAIGVFKGDSYRAFDEEELKKYARNVVGKRFLRLLKSLPTRIKRKIGVLRNDI